MEKKYCVCVHCGVEFLPTDSQWKHRLHRPIKTCSSLCRAAVVGFKNLKPDRHIARGPCLQCGNMFKSRTDKKFCSMKCYTQSPGFKQMVLNNCRKGNATAAKNAGNNLKGELRNCLECGKEFYSKPSQKNHKYCCHAHYRQYMAKRFDRHIASPETVALPQNYDEFLTQEDLPCLIPGCAWRGHGLSNHMNYSHGIPADEFKRAAGFNITTGVVSSTLHETLCGRPNIGVAIINMTPEERAEVVGKSNMKPRSYVSLERKEHANKARALVIAQSPGVIRHCLHCQRSFNQSTPFGMAKYCSIECRDLFYLDIKRQKKFECVCASCGKSFLGNAYQKARDREDIPVVCSMRCRATLNSPRGNKKQTTSIPASSHSKS